MVRGQVLSIALLKCFELQQFKKILQKKVNCWRIHLHEHCRITIHQHHTGMVMAWTGRNWYAKGSVERSQVESGVNRPHGIIRGLPQGPRAAGAILSQWVEGARVGCMKAKRKDKEWRERHSTSCGSVIPWSILCRVPSI